MNASTVRVNRLGLLSCRDVAELLDCSTRHVLRIAELEPVYSSDRLTLYNAEEVYAYARDAELAAIVAVMDAAFSAALDAEGVAS